MARTATATNINPTTGKRQYTKKKALSSGNVTTGQNRQARQRRPGNIQAMAALQAIRLILNTV